MLMHHQLEAAIDPWDDSYDYEHLWRLYQLLRDTPPVFDERHGGFWTLTRYDEVRAAATDYATFSSADGVVLGLGRKQRPFVPVEVDPPAAAVYRALLQPLMTRAQLEAVRPAIVAQVAAMVAVITERGTADVVQELCEPLPVAAISALVGLTPDEGSEMRELARRISAAGRDDTAAALAAFQAFLLDVLGDRRRRPRDDHLSRLAVAHVDGRPVPDDVLVTLVQGLVLAGHHTSITALSFLLWRVAQLGLLGTLAADPRLLAGAAQEALRLDPAIHLQGRRLRADVTVRGAAMKAGDYAILVFASANRDEREFARPDEFDARRPPHHLTFGYGIHRCLGMPLALLEMRAVIDEMTRAWRVVEVAEAPRIRAMLFGHHVGMEHLTLTVGAR
jgi:cytochrome P450